jgi:CRISPR system Cascade subunit CasA
LPETPLNLVTARWLPVRRRSGRTDLICPVELADNIDEDPAIAFAWRRADLDLASAEFCIGLLATCCSGQAEEDWVEWWYEPPDSETLAARFAAIEDLMILDGDGPRFLQDFAELEGEEVPIAGLLIDSPGANAIKRNTDLFSRRGRVERLGRRAAAIALFLLQAHAPSGGAGHRTSLRGGGPLTTLLLPGEEADDPPFALWHRLWPNVVAPDGAADPAADRRWVLPWLAPTRVSSGDAVTAPGKDADPLQVFWGQPRRVRLAFEANEAGLPCDLTGEVDPVIARFYRTRPHGVSYAGWGRMHPLTPSYRTKPGEAWLYVHPQPGRLAYSDYIGLVLGDPDTASATRAPARAVEVAKTRLEGLRLRAPARLQAAGYDMDNMKARGFVESEMPVHLVRGLHAETYAKLLRQLVAAAREAAGALAYAVRAAQAGDEARKGDPLTARDRFWAETEADFFMAARLLADEMEALEDPREAMDRRRDTWRARLAGAATYIFDELVPMVEIELQHMERLVGARSGLTAALAGYGDAGRRLFEALGLAAPESKPKKAKKEKR